MRGNTQTMFTILTGVVMGMAISDGAGDHRLAERTRMVERQIAARGITDERVLQAMRTVPRHLFVPDELQDHAYDDTPLPIGSGQTIAIAGLLAEQTRGLASRSTPRLARPRMAGPCSRAQRANPPLR